jgi:glutathione synthase/RimK-type ligase-like ATP-grasp enzyme
MKRVAIITDHLGIIEDDKNLPLAFANNGIEATAFDWKTGPALQDYDAALIRTPWDYPNQSDDFLSYLQEISKQTKLFHSSQLIQWNMDKKYLADLYYRGLDIVPTRVIPDFHPNKLFDLWDQFETTKIVVKPRVGAGGKNTFLLNENEITSELNNLLNQDVLVQPFVSEIQTEGEYSFIYFDEEFSHAVVKRATDGEFRIQEEHGGSTHSYQATDDEIRWGQALLEQLKLNTLYARVDLVRSEGKMILMELEVIEPQLFFGFSENGEEMLVKAMARRL